MNRRGYIALLGTAGAATLAGCLGGSDDGANNDSPEATAEGFIEAIDTNEPAETVNEFIADNESIRSWSPLNVRETSDREFTLEQFSIVEENEQRVTGEITIQNPLFDVDDSNLTFTYEFVKTESGEWRIAEALDGPDNTDGLRDWLNQF
jgi:hypothetical protein